MCLEEAHPEEALSEAVRPVVADESFSEKKHPSVHAPASSGEQGRSFCGHPFPVLKEKHADIDITNVVWTSCLRWAVIQG